MQDIEYYTYIHYFDKIISTFAPIYWPLNVFSIQCQLSEQKNPRICKQILRIIISAGILFGVTAIVLYYKIVYLYQYLLVSVKYTDIFQSIYDYFQYIIDLLFVFKYGSDMYYEYIKQYACIDEILGTTFYNEIKRRLIKVMTIIYCTWFCSSVFDYVIWFLAYGFLPTSAYALVYFYVFIKFLSNLDMTTHVLHIESRLRVIGDSVQDCYSAFENVSSIENKIKKCNLFYHEYSISTHDIRVRPVKKNLSLNWQDIKELSRCYLLLTEQVMFINKMFGIRTLLNHLSFLIDIVRFTNLTVRLLIGSQHSIFDNGYLPAISLTWRAISCVVAIVSVVAHCEQTYRQRERIISLIDRMIFDKHLDDQLLAAFKELRSLVETRRITFHMATFTTLNNTLLMSIASVVVTYTIILLSIN